MTGLSGKKRRYFTDLFLAVSTSPCLSEQWHGGDPFPSFCFQYECSVRLNTTELKTTAGVTEKPEEFHKMMEKWSKG